MNPVEIHAISEVNRYVLAHIGTLKEDVLAIRDLVEKIDKDTTVTRQYFELKLKNALAQNCKLRKEIRTVHVLLNKAVNDEMPMKPKVKPGRKPNART